MDRTGAAPLFHVVLIGALSLSLAHVSSVPEPPSMDVEFVEDVGLTSAHRNRSPHRLRQPGA